MLVLIGTPPLTTWLSPLPTHPPQVHFLTIIPMFKVTEHYDTARPTRNMRRDLRPGEAAATTSRTPQGGWLWLRTCPVRAQAGWAIASVRVHICTNHRQVVHAH